MMKKKYKITIAVWLCIILTGAIIASASRNLVAMVDFVFLVLLILMLDVEGSVYKPIRLFHYRHYHRQHELLLSSNQLYPSRIMNFLMDEEREEKGSPAGHTILPQVRKD